MGSQSELIWLRIGAMAAVVDAWMNRRFPGNAGNCWTEERLASYEGLCSVDLGLVVI